MRTLKRKVEGRGDCLRTDMAYKGLDREERRRRKRLRG